MKPEQPALNYRALWPFPKQELEEGRGGKDDDPSRGRKKGLSPRSLRAKQSKTLGTHSPRKFKTLSNLISDLGQPCAVANHGDHNQQMPSFGR